MADELVQGVLDLLALPRGEQPDAVERLLARATPVSEAWNTRFGPDSLFDAWTGTTVVQGLYAANAAVLRDLLDGREDWCVVEVGAGDGSLWEQVLRPDDRGTVVFVDPVPEAHEVARRKLPPGVTARSLVQRVEEAALPEADAVVCSLTLHHLAGRDRAEREAHGLTGPGKLEVLRAFARSTSARRGLVLLVEADVHCEIDLAPGDPVLRDRLLDSYVRRCGLSIVHDLAAATGERADRLRAILQGWCLEQVRAWTAPLAERDVYELDVGRWRELAARAELHVTRVRCTDRYGLFYQYVLRPRVGPPA